jgi:uncharacterized protein YbjT (DUF2867 family)
MPKTALLAGATGLVGGHVLRTLLVDDAYETVTALVRRPLALEHPKLRTAIVDFDQFGQSAVKIAADDAYCCIGITLRAAGSKPALRKVDHGYIVDLARLARASGTRQFLLVSSISANARSPFFYTRTKGQTERDITKLGFSAAHFFRPSLLRGERTEPRPLEEAFAVLFKFIEPILGGPLSRYHSVQSSDVGRAMVAAAHRHAAGVHVHHYDEIIDLVRSPSPGQTARA